MDVFSLCPLPAATHVFQITPSRWVLTVVCKATYRLEPGALTLASAQEPIYEQEQHWDGDLGRSLMAPADLVPFKPRVDVVLVGSAYAPGGAPARSVIARVVVGSIDKSIEVVSPRVRTRDGETREGKRWTRTPLLYERAAGGPDTDNPVGLRRDGPRDPYGQLPLPCLRPAGYNGGDEGMPPPIGFGPIAASWPSRRSKTGAGAATRDWAAAPFGEGFDLSYFQAAPADQQADALRPGERIALENLHPKHATLVTALPADRALARVELSGAPAREIALVADTLWIDTDRSICTVTSRARVDMRSRDHSGTIWVATTKGEQPIAWPKVALAPPPPPPASPAPTMASPAPPSALRRASPVTAPPPPRDDPDAPEETMPFRQADVHELDAELVEAVEITQTEHVTSTLVGGSVSLTTLPFRPATPPPPAPSRPATLSAPRSEGAREPSPPAPTPPTILPDWFDAGEMPPLAPTWSSELSAAPSPRQALPIAPPLKATPLGALEASNAAAGADGATPGRAPPSPSAVAEADSPAVIELIWFEPDIGARLNRCPALAQRDVPRAGDPPKEGSADAAAALRAKVYDVLSRGAPTPASALEAMLFAAEQEGAPGSPLALVSGVLDVCLDEIEHLKATVAIAGPLAASDKKLRDVLDLAAEALKAPMQGMPDFADALRARVGEAWQKANKLLPPTHLAASAERQLLEQRMYKRRELLDEAWIRAQLPGAGPDELIPTYLPLAVAKRLPLFKRFPARLVAEVMFQQDQYEPHPVALRVIALGRAPARSPARGAKAKRQGAA